MKIKLINYPYYGHPVGEIIDLGEELNASLVSFNRAVWIETKKAPPLKEVIKEVVEAVTQPHPPKKKLLANSLREKVQAKKKRNLNDDIDI